MILQSAKPSLPMIPSSTIRQQDRPSLKDLSTPSSHPQNITTNQTQLLDLATKDPGNSIAAAVYGAPVANNEDRAWVANGYFRNRQFQAVQNQYVALGRVRNGLTATSIRGLAAEYMRDHPDYNLATSNCYNYCMWVWDEIK
ncbi:MAG: hypothetical protein M1830_006343 [Pleopsidium flavum]|nr:MAG: hypothetical protein M1830_006343 [Pleopsidium flavum]